MSDGIQSSRVHVKICGLREPNHAKVAIDAGASMLGMIFAEAPRRISIGEARAIRAVVGPRSEVLDSSTRVFDAAIQSAGRPLLVGVFARQSPDEINRVIDETDIDVVQLSGGEHPSIAARLTRPVIRAIHVDAESSVETIRRETERMPQSVTLLDAKSRQGGGGGVTFDWSLATAIATELPLMLAGGLSPDNVADAVTRVQPWAVDVSSGVETDGRKDADKIRAFIAAADRVGSQDGSIP
jgi:phosphoribosylanthranilate isomerase